MLARLPLPAFIVKWLCDPVVRAKMKKWLSWASNFVGAYFLTVTYTFIHTHFGSIIADGRATEIAGIVSASAGGLILTVGSIFFDLVDANNVDAKIKAVAVTGDASAANNVAFVQQVKTISKTIDAPSGTPAALQELKDKLTAAQL